MTDEEILEYATVNYPIGTKYNSLGGSNGEIVTGYRINRDYDARYLEGLEGVLYRKDTNIWATIISYPSTSTEKVLTKEEKLEALAYEKYPVGTKIQGSWWSVNEEDYPDDYFEVTEKTKFFYNSTHIWCRESKGGTDLRSYKGNTFVAYYDNSKWGPIYVPRAEKYKVIREKLKSIIEEEDITNIDLQDEGFMISWGDVLNQSIGKNSGKKERDNDYYLLGLYTYIPYTFVPGNFKLHREVVNEYETRGEKNSFEYSGFTHYNGGVFCFGECGVDHLANTIRDEGLTSDNLNLLLLKFHTYLSVSSHGTIGSYKTLDLTNTAKQKVSYKLNNITKINGLSYPTEVIKTTSNVGIQKIDYTKPYKEVLKEKTDKAFMYNGNKIIPKIVKHEMIQDTTTIEESIRVDLKTIKEFIKQKQLDKIYDEINNKTPITFKDLLYKLPNKLSRVDECVYI